MCISNIGMLLNDGGLNWGLDKLSLNRAAYLRWNDIFNESRPLNVVLFLFQSYHILLELVQLVFYQINIFS